MSEVEQDEASQKIPMEILSLGFSKTGTMSMQEAYQILGYPNPYHMTSVFADLKKSQLWAKALNAKIRNDTSFDYEGHLNQLLENSGAVTDQPSVLFWRELIEIYPEAKVVLVERDEDSWYASMDRLLDSGLSLTAKTLAYTDPLWFGKTSNIFTPSFKYFLGTTNLKQAKANARKAYRAHNATIKASVPKEKLLVYEMGSGWDPLCRFLGKDVPDQPFPWINEAADFQQMSDQFYAQGIQNSLFNLGIVAGVAASLAFVAWRWIGTSAW